MSDQLDGSHEELEDGLMKGDQLIWERFLAAEVSTEARHLISRMFTQARLDKRIELPNYHTPIMQRMWVTGYEDPREK